MSTFQPSISAIRGEFENSFSHFFAEIENGKIVGYLCVRTLYEEAQICNIAVLPEFRRLGHATELIKRCVGFAKENGCERCELEVNTDNKPAFELYCKCGFKIAGTRKNFYRKSRYNSRDAYTLIYSIL